MGEESAKAEILVARIAARQHGVVTLRQLEGAGVGRSAVTRRVRLGRLHRVHRGVYAVGHPALSCEGRWLASVLATGPRAVLSHASAGALWGLLPPAASDVVQVTVPGQAGRRRRAGIAVHRSLALEPRHVTRRAAIPVTTPSRTLADLRRVLPAPRFARALREAEFLGLPIKDRLGADRTRSELEARFLALIRRRRIPAPKVNERVGPFVVDFLWPAQRLVVELDGYRAHRGRAAFEADRARDVRLKMLGYGVVRFTWRQVSDAPAEIAASLRALLGSG